MAHAEVHNRTPFVFEALHLVDEELRPLLVPLVKGTFDIGKDGRCVRAEKQEPVSLSGECWGDDPGTSSYKYEPEIAFVKPATDVVLMGHAHAPRRDTTEMTVALRVGARGGALEKQIAVLGDRVWHRVAGFMSATKPRSFERIPLVYERAFGGWDRSQSDPTKHSFEPRNPVGTGFRGSGTFQDGLRLPNLEDPEHPLRSLGGRPPPAGFGFVSPHWQPRAALAGTFDDAWQRGRAPMLPKDFDRRHLNAASPGLVAAGYLRGDEAIAATGVGPSGATLSFALPGVVPPRVRAHLSTAAAPADVPLNLDTIIVDADDRRVLLLWRGRLALRTGPHDVRAIEISETAPS